jgi:hypothetical protein
MSTNRFRSIQCGARTPFNGIQGPRLRKEWVTLVGANPRLPKAPRFSLCAKGWTVRSKVGAVGRLRTQNTLLVSFEMLTLQSREELNVIQGMEMPHAQRTE